MRDSSGSGGDEFIVVHRFMLQDLELKGIPLLLYARVYGFCRSGIHVLRKPASSSASSEHDPRSSSVRQTS